MAGGVGAIGLRGASGGTGFGRGGVAPGEGANGALAEEGRGRFGGARGGAAGEEGALRARSAFGPGEGEGGRPFEPSRGVAPGTEPFEGRPGAATEPGMRMGSGSGFGAGEVEAPRGFGQYGGMGAGRRNDDDEERPMPDYLVESSDSWAGEQSASPAVIGE
jgi:hypothetical protein